MAIKQARQPGALGWRIGALLRRVEFWLTLGGLLIVSGVLWLIGEQLVALLERAASARTLITAFGPLAPVAYIVLFALQILIAPLPGQFMGVMSGYLFGAFWGSAYSIIGLTIGAGIAMTVARLYGKPLLDRFFDPVLVRQWERKLRMRSPVTWALLFLFPVPDLVFYVAGLSRVPLRHLLLAVISGRSLGLILANTVGTLSASLPPEWVVIKWGFLLVAGYFLYRYQRLARLSLLLAWRSTRRMTRRWQQWLRGATKA
jgi:uncharacterized membrane protein YdjX (TVP38/TMEM64 family)